MFYCITISFCDSLVCPDDMIRISVGIEDIEDLKEDFKRVIEGDDENGKS